MSRSSRALRCVVRGVDGLVLEVEPNRACHERVVERPAVALLKLTLEYDGGAFRGWARRPGRRTVEGALREALDAIYPHGWDGLAVAGRATPECMRPDRSRASR